MKTVNCKKCKGTGKLTVPETRIDRKIKSLYEDHEAISRCIMRERNGKSAPSKQPWLILCKDMVPCDSYYDDCKELADLEVQVMDLRCKQEDRPSHGVRYCAGAPHRVVRAGDPCIVRLAA